MSLRHQLLQSVALVALQAVSIAATAQVFRCTVKDQVVYQQAPCAVSGGSGAALKIHATAAPPTASASAIPKPAQAAPVTAPPPAVVNIGPASALQRSDLQTDADTCLDWHRPMLRDPRSAYWRDAEIVQGVLNITVHATNGFGGYVTRPAACEFKNGLLDEGWTKTQAKRRGWAV